MKTKCDKCDERGYIQDGGGSAHSCECGFALNPPTAEQWAKWINHKSNKDRWIEEQERQDEIQEDTTDMESKLEDLNN